MAEIKANGDELIACGESIIALSESYNEQINKLFSSLSKLNKTGWSGAAADSYVSKLSLDRKKFIAFGDYIKMYGRVIQNTGNNVNRIITKWDDK